MVFFCGLVLGGDSPGAQRQQPMELQSKCELVTRCTTLTTTFTATTLGGVARVKALGVGRITWRRSR